MFRFEYGFAFYKNPIERAAEGIFSNSGKDGKCALPG